MKTILITGAAGFIGSNFVKIALSEGHKVIAFDALTYAGHVENLADFETHRKFHFVKGLIQDRKTVCSLLYKFQVDWLVHLAAESHADKSVTGPADFIETNINGTFQVLVAAREYADTLASKNKENFRFLHVSTDEVFGAADGARSALDAPLRSPNSPYAATKAAADLLVSSWNRTYKLPTIITHSSSNYGPKQFPEKLIPHTIYNALQGKSLSVYGAGDKARDWIHVKDHVRGLLLALEKGSVGSEYCFGGGSERSNLSIVESIAKMLDKSIPRSGGSYLDQIEFVQDRPGHDFRYSMVDEKAKKELGFLREFTSFEDGLKDTIAWYINNNQWSQKVTSKHGSSVNYNWGQIVKNLSHNKSE